MNVIQTWPAARIWQYHAVVTQANAGGGAIVLDVPCTRGTQFFVLHAHGINSGTNTLRIRKVDEDGVTSAEYAQIASAATTEAGIPRAEDDPTLDSALIDSTDIWTRHFAGDDRFEIRQTAAGAQNDTLTVDWRIRLLGIKPVPNILNSVNPGDVTIATPTVDVIV